MTDLQIWLLIFIIGVVAFCVGVLLPHRQVQVLGAVVAAVGGIGWTIVALSQ
jgi:hypothetical protein